MKTFFADGQFSVEQCDFQGKSQWSCLNWHDSRLQSCAFPSHRLANRTDTELCPHCGAQFHFDICGFCTDIKINNK